MYILHVKNLLLAGLFFFLISSPTHADRSWTVTSSLTHATDCTSGGVQGAVGQLCTDLDNGALWTCKTPSAGGAVDVCDSPGDWLLTGVSVTGTPGITSLNSAVGAAQTIGGTAPVSVTTNTGANTTTVALTDGGVTNAKLADNAVNNAKLADNAVGNAELADMVNPSMKCRVSAGTGDPEDCNMPQVVGMLDFLIATQTEIDALSSGLSTPGTLNNGSNPVDWTKIKNMPAAFADGTDDGSAGGVISFNGRTGVVSPAANDYSGAQVSNAPSGGIIATTTQAAITELDTEKATAATLSTPGTLNNAGNPVDWTQLKNVPAGFADGTDDGAGGSTPTLQAVADAGRSVTNAVDLASAFCVGGATEKHCFYGNATDGAVWSVAGNGDITWVLSDTFDLNIEDAAGASIINVDETTKTTTFGGPVAFSTPQMQSSYWEAGGMTVDGTNCTAATEQLLNGAGSPRVRAFSCADTNASQFFGSMVMPDSYTGGTVTFELTVMHGTTETITFGGAFSAMCRRPGTVINTTWGTDQSADVAITTAFQPAQATSPAVTPNGTCAAGDVLFWRYVITAGTFSTNAATTKVLGVKMEFPTSSLSD